MSSRVAVCLNSSFFGFYAHAGFMQGLGEAGLEPHALSGASAGALVAGLLAAGKSAPEVIALLLQPKLRTILFDWALPWRALGTCTNRPGRTGAVTLDGALRFLRTHLDGCRIEDCTSPRLAIAVTNLSTPATEIITRGPLAEFILGSGAFPGIFAAREIEGSLYWDGGIANPVPIDPWLSDSEIDTILVHSVANPAELAVRRAGCRITISGAFNLAHQIVSDELLRFKSEAAERLGKRLIFLRTEAPRPGLLNAHRIGSECVAAGLATARANHALLKELGT